MTDTHRGYKVVRYYHDRPGHRRTINARCTLAEAQAHCDNPETSSRTATTAAAGAARPRSFKNDRLSVGIRSPSRT